MTDNEINMSIATSCGWQVFNPRNANHKLPNGDWECGVPIPDYVNDLNAMHEAEEVLKRHEQLEFKCILDDMIPPPANGLSFWRFIHATARQRAEAFLKTVGRWKD